MYKANISIEITGETYEAVKTITSQVYKGLVEHDVKDHKWSTMEISYEKDGEYLDADAISKEESNECI